MGALFSNIAEFFTSIFTPLFSLIGDIGSAIVSFFNGTVHALIGAVAFVSEILSNFILFIRIPLPAFVLVGLGAIIGIFAVKVVIDLL